MKPRSPPRTRTQPRKGQVVIPLYEQVKQFVLSKVASDALQDGARVPSEHELAKALRTSRVTVNRALRELSQQGLVSRVQGLGTFVRTPTPRSSLVEIRNIAEDIRSRGHRHRAQVLTLEALRADRALALFFQMRRSGKIFHSLIVHFENEVPLQLEERFVNPQFAPRYLEQDFTRQTTSEYLHTISFVTEVEHTVQSTVADARTRGLLKMRSGEPCLKMLRDTWVGRLPTSRNIFIYPGTRYALVSRYRVGES